MKKSIKATLAILLGVVVLISISGCSIFEAKIEKVKSIMGMASDKDVIVCTSELETGCEDFIKATE